MSLKISRAAVVCAFLEFGPESRVIKENPGFVPSLEGTKICAELSREGTKIDAERGGLRDEIPFVDIGGFTIHTNHKSANAVLRMEP